MNKKPALCALHASVLALLLSQGRYKCCIVKIFFFLFLPVHTAGSDVSDSPMAIKPGWAPTSVKPGWHITGKGGGCIVDNNAILLTLHDTKARNQTIFYF